MARAAGSWRELRDRGAIWLSWRELRSRGVSCGFVARAAWSIDGGGSNTLKSTHSMQNSERCCVLGQGFSSGVGPVTVAGVVDVDSASFVYFARVSHLLLFF